MALINSRASDNGAICQFLYTSAMVYTYPPDPAATISLSFDESTNAALIADMQANLSAYSLAVIAGAPTLQKNGTPVTIAAPSSLYSLQSTILNGVPDATLKAAIVALWNGSATTQQQQRALAYCLLKLKQAGTI